MTFEEFFIKKKIDLALLERAEPALYEEFRQHYTQMGEKSFDHTKKYWFNRLRKTFLLETAEIPVAKPSAATTVTVTEGSTAPAPEATKPTGLSSMSPSGFKPRFKASAAKTVPDPMVPSEKPQGETPPSGETREVTRPTGFRPRFKAGTTTGTKPKDSPTEIPKMTGKEETEPAPADKPTMPAAKPVGFKPRFKPGVTPPTKAATGGDLPTPPAEAPQPDTESGKPVSEGKPLGFRPRFKAGVTNTPKPNAEGEKSEKEKAEPAPEPTPGTTSKPLGFKPRFKAGSTPPRKDDPT